MGSEHFVIQASTPRTLRGDIDTDDSAILERIFATDCEDAYLLWNWIPIKMSYKYDLSVMLEDLVPLLDDLSRRESGVRSVHWGSSTFNAAWDLAWADGVLILYAKWFAVAGNYERLLATRPRIELPTKAFLAEWTMPMRAIRDAVHHAGDQSLVGILPDLEDLLTRTGEPGQLYGGSG